MGKDTSSSEKGKKEENKYNNVRTISTRSSTSSSPPQETSGLRRSSRETPSKKPAPMPSTTRKSERLEKQTPSPPSISNKSEKIEKKNAPSPLRRSSRGKNVSSGSRKSSRTSGAPSGVNQKGDIQKKSTENSARKITECKAQMTAKDYRAMFMRQPKTSEYLADQQRNRDDANLVDDNKSDQGSAKDLAETFTQVANGEPLEQAKSPSAHSIGERCHVEEEVANGEPLEEVESPAAHSIGEHCHVEEEAANGDPQDEGKSPPARSIDENCHVEEVNASSHDLEFGVSDEVKEVLGDKDGTVKQSENPQMDIDSTEVMQPEHSEGTIPSASGCENDDHPETCNTSPKRHKVNHDSAKLVNSTCIINPDQDINCTAEDSEQTEAIVGMDFGGRNEQIIQQDESLDCMIDSSSYLEYWVPVQISDVQLEQYCLNLVSKSLSLCSLLKNDPLNALHDTLISARKTCDHPYAVDQSLQSLLIENLPLTEILGVGIKASGKLQLLDAMLTEIKKKGSKAVVFFQTFSGPGRSLIGDILDDFIRQRFGETSFERIDRDVVTLRKQHSLNRFNKDSERFVLLLETRACSNSINLSSAEAFILFNSSWNPWHDVKLIQKLKIISQSEKPKIFRFYSPCTIEEKALLLAKQNKPVAENPSPLIIHTLLMWGASYVFDELDRFHSNQPTESGVLFEQSIIDGVIDEILCILSLKGGDKKKKKLCLISEARHIQDTYSVDSTLFGEERGKLLDEDTPNRFWTKLLKGKSPNWKYCPVPTPRSRKRVRYVIDPEASGVIGSNGILRKRKKAVSDSSDPAPLHDEETACAKDGQKGPLESQLLSLVQQSPSSPASDENPHANDALEFDYLDSISKIPEEMLAGNDGRKSLSESQKSFLDALKPEMEKLCHVLHLSEDVTIVVENVLEYVVNYHHVCKEQTTLLQAFQIATCWIGAKLQKQKINQKESLSLAKDQLAYGCSRGDVDYIYSMLYCLRSMFKNRLDENITIDDQRSTDIDSMRKDIDKSISYIAKKRSQQLRKLMEKLDEEKMEVTSNYEKGMSDLEKTKKAKELVISIAWRDGSMHSKLDELKKVDYEFERKFDNLRIEEEESLKILEEKYDAEKKKLTEIESEWTRRIKEWAEELLRSMISKTKHCSGINSSNTCRNAPDVAETSGEALEESGEGMDPLPEPQSLVGSTLGQRNEESPREMVLLPEHHDTSIRVDDSPTPDQASQDMHQSEPTPDTDRQHIEGVEPCIAELQPSDEAEMAEPPVAGLQPSDEAEMAEPPVAELQPSDEAEMAEPPVAELQPSDEAEIAKPPVAEPLPHEVETNEPPPILHEVEMPEPSTAEPLSYDAEMTDPLIAEPAVHEANHDEQVAQPAMAEPSTDASLPTNNTPQTASLPPMPAHLFNDPFQYELEKIRREVQTATKTCEDINSQLSAEFERKMAELKQEFDLKFRETHVKFQETTNKLEAYRRIVVMNKYLADAFKVKCEGPNTPSAHAASRHADSELLRLFQPTSSAPPSRPTAAVTSTAPPPPVPPAARQPVRPPRPHPPVPPQRSRLSPTSQLRPPLITNAAASSAFPSPVSTTPPVFNRVRAPAPHLHSYRSSSAPGSLPRGPPAPHSVQNPSQSSAPPAVANRVPHAPSPAFQNPRPARTPSNPPGSAAEPTSAASAAAAYSSMLIQQQQLHQQQQGSSTCGLESNHDVVSLSDDDDG